MTTDLTISEAELVALAQQALPQHPLPEVLAELGQLNPDPNWGNAHFVRRLLVLILHQVQRESGDLMRLRQLVGVAQDDYRDLYLIVSDELHDPRSR